MAEPTLVECGLRCDCAAAGRQCPFFHHPLHEMKQADRQAYLDAHDLTDELLPRGLTGAARTAALAPQEKAMPDPIAIPAVGPSFVPPKLHAIAAVVAGIGGVALLAIPSLGAMLPAWVGFAVFALTAIACFLSGLALPTGLAGKPIVPLTAVPTLAAIAAALGHFAEGMPDGTLKAGLMLAVALLLGLAGVVMPAPGQKVSPPAA